MRLHLLDPQLYTSDGHYLNYDTAIVEEFRRRRIQTHIYGAAIRQGTLPQTLPADHVFRHDIFDEVGQDETTWALENFTQLNAVFREDLATIVPGRLSGDDLAFFPNLIQNQLDGVRQWILSLPVERRPTIAVKLSYLMHEMRYVKNRPHHGIMVPLLRCAIRQLVAAHPRTVICSDTEEMVEAFQRIAGVPVGLLPLPLALDHLGAAPSVPRDESARPCVVFLGNAIPRKGFHLLPEVIRRVMNIPSAPRFIVQFYGGHPPIVDKIERELAALPSGVVTVVRGTVDAATYARLIHQADIVLFPYFREFYRWASSGVFTEAMSLGKVSVAPADTWIARQLRKYDAGGATFTEAQAEPVAEALRQACSNLGQRLAQAQRASELWRREHSPRNFVDLLLAQARMAGVEPALAAGR